MNKASKDERFLAQKEAEQQRKAPQAGASVPTTAQIQFPLSGMTPREQLLMELKEALSEDNTNIVTEYDKKWLGNMLSKYGDA